MLAKFKFKMRRQVLEQKKDPHWLKVKAYYKYCKIIAAVIVHRN